MTGKRRRAREMAIQMLYQKELGGSSLAQIFDSFDVTGYLTETDSAEVAEPSEDGAAPPAVGDPVPRTRAEGGAMRRTRVEGDSMRRTRADKAFEYARRLVTGTIENTAAIDEVIRRHAENWRIERMPTIDRNILRLAVYEMLYEEGVPKVVIVDEAIELAKKFGSENSGRFVNGLLDGIMQSEEREAPAGR